MEDQNKPATATQEEATPQSTEQQQPAAQSQQAPAENDITLANWTDIKKTDGDTTNTKDEVAADFAKANADASKPVEKKKNHTLDEYKGFAYTAHFVVDEAYSMLTNAFKFKWAEIDHKGGLQVNNKEKFDQLVKSLAELLYIEQIEIPKILKWFFYGAGVFLSYKELYDMQAKDFLKIMQKDQDVNKQMSAWVNEKFTTQDEKPATNNKTKAA